MERRARVGSGAPWARCTDAASEAGLAPLSGSSRDVGIRTGYSLGGGMGWLGRKHGLQSNALTAVEIVTADGELRRIDHVNNETDLFWAVRGGGERFRRRDRARVRPVPGPRALRRLAVLPVRARFRADARVARVRVRRAPRRGRATITG